MNGTMFGDLDWPPNASRRFVSISWASSWTGGGPQHAGGAEAYTKTLRYV